MRQKTRLLTLLALLLTAATGAWAQESATTYSVKMKDGTVDAANWSIASGEKSATGDAADGLTELSEGDQVTIQYTGRLKVKGVKATSDAAAEESDLLAGVFSVSSTKKVCFSKGNLQATYNGTDWTWAFAENQWDYIGNAAGNTSIDGNGTVSASNVTVDLFGWVGASSTWTGAAQYGISNSKATNNTDGYGNKGSDALKSDWGNTISDGNTWFTLTSGEWTYLLNARSASTVGGTEKGRYAKAKVNDVQGVILFPDTYTHPDGVTAPTGVNATGNAGWNGNNYDATAWAKMEAAGCVFLPAAGYRSQASVDSAGSCGQYWSSSPWTSNANMAYYVYFYSAGLLPARYGSRYNGNSVRLVQEVAPNP